MAYTTTRKSRRRKRRRSQMDKLIRLGGMLTVILVFAIVLVLVIKKFNSDGGETPIVVDVTTNNEAGSTDSNGESVTPTTAGEGETTTEDETTTVDPYGDLHQYYGDSINDDGKIIVCIDAGHGGIDGGCVGPNDRLEKTDALNFALALKPELEALGATVYLTRSDDSFPELESRPLYANSVKADVFVSIHRNSYASDSSVHGIEAWISSQNADNSYKLANDILTVLDGVGISRNRGIRTGTQGNASQDYAVNSISSMPSVLLEMGFITAPDDNANLDSKKSEYAKAMAKAIVDFINAQ